MSVLERTDSRAYQCSNPHTYAAVGQRCSATTCSKCFSERNPRSPGKSISGPSSSSSSSSPSLEPMETLRVGLVRAGQLQRAAHGHRLLQRQRNVHAVAVGVVHEVHEARRDGGLRIVEAVCLLLEIDFRAPGERRRAGPLEAKRQAAGTGAGPNRAPRGRPRTCGPWARRCAWCASRECSPAATSPSPPPGRRSSPVP